MNKINFTFYLKIFMLNGRKKMVKWNVISVEIQSLLLEGNVCISILKWLSGKNFILTATRTISGTYCQERKNKTLH